LNGQLMLIAGAILFIILTLVLILAFWRGD